MQQTNCGICTSQPFKYTCPRCNLNYCSLSCYKHESHLQCTESFYKDNIQQEMQSKGGSAASKYYLGEETKGPDTSEADMKRKMMQLLQRFESGDHGAFNEEVGEEDDDDVLEERLKGLDLDSISVEDLIALLPESHLKAFETQIQQSGLLDSETFTDALTTPWWIHTNSGSLIQDIDESKSSQSQTIPSHLSSIVPFSTLTKAQPHSSLPFNIAELLCIYSIVWRRFNGEFSLEEEQDPRTLLTQLSLILKDQEGGGSFGYDSVESAVIGVWDRVIRMNSIFLPDTISSSEAPAKKVLEVLFTDLQHLISSRNTVVAALSHLHDIFATKPQVKEFKKICWKGKQ
ncbi:hypothetical protein HDU79_008190 [Rhizoclosmatium sp. JEL0117]|nr:hypothetical protein HDU79_008190 [Rhizoclosmatium sp. JEL0117]